MKSESWVIEDRKLVCYYETYHGKKGKKVFFLFRNEEEIYEYRGKTEGVMTYWFREDGTKYMLNRVTWCNLNKCYVPTYNNTKLAAFIRADLKQLL